MTLKNKIVMPPMCMYSADAQGFPCDFHYIHYTARAIGGVGLIIVEAAGVMPNGRLSDNDLGIWDDAHIPGLERIVKGVQCYGSKIAIQLNHGGRKYVGSSGNVVAPSALSFSPEYPMPIELTEEAINEIVESFVSAAVRANSAGFDAIEIHGAHGYLIHEFLSPLSNQRSDKYGGTVKNRARFLTQVLQSVRAVWPEEKPIFLRVSASDYISGGITPDEMVEIINEVKEYVDVVDVSSGGLQNAEINLYPGYQVAFAEKIKNQCNIPTVAVGLITESHMVEEILCNNRADFVALGRELLRNPFWVQNTAMNSNAAYDIPVQYKRAYPSK